MASPSENPASREEEPEPAPGSTFVFSHDPEDFPPPPPRPETGAESASADFPFPPRPAPAASPSWTARDRLGIIIAAVVIGGVLLTLGGLLHAVRPEGPEPVALPAPELPIAGELFTLSDVRSGWRNRAEADQVSDMPVVLPQAGMRKPALLPEVRFTLDASKASTGFLRFIFLDPGERIAGDVRTVKVVNGRVEPPGPAPESGAVHASVGFTDIIDYLYYAADPESPRWYVEVSESTDEDAGESGWRKLQVFEIGNGRLDE